MTGIWTLKIIRVGRILSNSNAPLLGVAEGHPVELPIWMGALTDGKHNVLVDTGIGEDLAGIMNGPEPNCRQSVCEHTANALKAATGWNPEDVELVINTHLHYDHCGGNALFRNARFLLQKKEWESAIKADGAFGYLYYKKYFTEPAMPFQKWEFLDGEAVVFPGLTVFPTPGHTAGHQSVLVETKRGAVCYAGDAVSVLENIRDNIVTSIYSDQTQSLESFAKIRKRTCIVIPGHDYRLSNGSDDGFLLA